MAQKYIVKLTGAERESLHSLIWQEKQSARQVTRARILLLSDDSETDQTIAQVLHVHVNTIERIRAKFIEGGVELALHKRWQTQCSANWAKTPNST
jgi:hypothetical protein